MGEILVGGLPVIATRHERYALDGRPWSLAVAVAVVAAIGCGELLWATRWYGLTVTNDSVAYAELADHLRAGDGWAGAPWPPLYPLLLAAIGRLTTLDAYGAAIVVNVASLLAIVVATFSILQRTLHSMALVILGALVTATSPPVQGIVTMMSSDAPFIAGVAVLIAVLPGFLTPLRSRQAFCWAVVLIWGLWLTRWAGQFVAAAAWLTILVVPRQIPCRRRLRASFEFGAAMLVLPMLWMVRNLVVTGVLNQGSSGSEENLKGALRDTFSSFAQWMTGRPLPNRLVAAIGAGIVMAVIGGVAAVLRRPAARAVADGAPNETAAVRATRAALLATCLMMVAVYAGVLTIGKAYVGYDLDPRVLAPVFVPLLVLGLYVADSVIERLSASPTRPGSRATATATVFVILGLWAAIVVGSGLLDAQRLSRHGKAFSSEAVHRLDVIDALHRLPTDCRLLSNQPGMLRYLGGPIVASVPARMAYGSDVLTDELPRFVASSRTTSTCIVWLEAGITDRFLYPLAELQGSALMQRVDGGENEGATIDVYRVDAG